jgi:hypothetical protein
MLLLSNAALNFRIADDIKIRPGKFLAQPRVSRCLALLRLAHKFLLWFNDQAFALSFCNSSLFGSAQRRPGRKRKGRGAEHEDCAERQQQIDHSTLPE